MRVIRTAGFWILLVALLAFVVFVECLADVGGSRDAIPAPTPSAESRNVRAAGTGLFFELEDQFGVVVADERALAVIGDPGLLGAPA